MRRPAAVAFAVLAAISLLAAACAAQGEADEAGGLTTGDTGAPTSGPSANTGADATVERVVDGDTLVVSIGGNEERLRLIGIDTPETVDPRKPVQCFGKEASAYMTDLVPPGTSVRLVRDVEARDRYGRLLVYVYRASDDLFVNMALVRDGYAQVATFPPNVAYADDFRAAAAEARSEGRGLWSACEGSG